MVGDGLRRRKCRNPSALCIGAGMMRALYRRHLFGLAAAAPVTIVAGPALASRPYANGGFVSGVAAIGEYVGERGGETIIPFRPIPDISFKVRYPSAERPIFDPRVGDTITLDGRRWQVGGKLVFDDDAPLVMSVADLAATLGVPAGEARDG